MKKFFILFALVSSSCFAEVDVNNYSTSLDYAQVTEVTVSQQSDKSWCFNVSIRHHDQGWEHYADGWEVSDLKGKQLGYRLLAHPHDNEQPFTRSLCGINIPTEQSKVIVRAKCNKHGYGGKALLVELK